MFCNRKPAAEWLARRLSAAGYPAAPLTADLPQAERMAAMTDLRSFKLRVVVATDVMARGVDLERVNLVALLDTPPDAATYVHRVGRTGRFGTRGVSVAFVTSAELGRLQELVAEARGGEPAGGRAGGRTGSEQALGSGVLQLPLMPAAQANKARSPLLPPPTHTHAHRRPHAAAAGNPRGPVLL